VYNSTFLIIYKPLSLIISPQTFSIQLGAGTSLFCLSQCAIPFCPLLASIGKKIKKRKYKKNNNQKRKRKEK